MNIKTIIFMTILFSFLNITIITIELSKKKEHNLFYCIIASIGMFLTGFCLAILIIN